MTDPDVGALVDDWSRIGRCDREGRPASGIASFPDTAGRIQQMTLLHVRLLRTIDAANGQLALIAQRSGQV